MLVNTVATVHTLLHAIIPDDDNQKLSHKEINISITEISTCTSNAELKALHHHIHNNTNSKSLRMIFFT